MVWPKPHFQALGVDDPPDLPRGSTYVATALPIARTPILLRHPIVRLFHCWYRNVDLFPIAYAYRPRLRDRPDPERTNLPQETLDFRRVRFSRTLSLLVPAGLFRTLHHSLRCDFTAYGMLPYPSRIAPESRSFGDMLEPC